LRDMPDFHSDAQKSCPTDAAVDTSWTRSIAPTICSLSEFHRRVVQVWPPPSLVRGVLCVSAASVRLSRRRTRFGVHACSRSSVKRQETVCRSDEPSTSPRSTARKSMGIAKVCGCDCT